jgi:hypothetical protein
MADSLTPENWGLKESADWWSAGQVVRQQIYGAATEMMRDLAGVKAGSGVLDVATGTGESTLMAARRLLGHGDVGITARVYTHFIDDETTPAQDLASRILARAKKKDAVIPDCAAKPSLNATARDKILFRFPNQIGRTNSSSAQIRT